MKNLSELDIAVRLGGQVYAPGGPHLEADLGSLPDDHPAAARLGGRHG
jgi:hypothetical protein